MILSGAQILIEELVRNKVDTVFGYPGGTVLPIYDELYKNSHRIKHIIAAHEQGAAFAADGYARAGNKVGVVIATSGPGATNIVTGIANAHLDSVPMVAITGNVALPLIGKDSFQEVDILSVTQPIVKHSFVVRDVSKLAYIVREAFLIANEGRKGPVLIDIPKDIQTSNCEYEMEMEIEKEVSTVELPVNLEEALESIRNSERPFIYGGGGIISASAEKELMEFSKLINAPVGLSLMGLTALPSDFELNLGMCGMHGKYSSTMAQGRADVIIALGVRFSDRATGNTVEFAKGRTIIHVDIDEAEIQKNVESKVNVCGDVKKVIREMINRLEPKENTAWLEEVEGYKAHQKYEINRNFSPENIIKTINSFAGDEAVVATDVGQHQMWTTLYYDFKKPRSLLTSGGLGAMGYGLGAAIGAAVAKFGNKTVLFTGDGSFGMNLNELSTAVSQNLPILIVVLNNRTLGMVRQWQTMFFEERYSHTTLGRKTDFSKLAEAFGAKGYKVKSLNNLEEILSELKLDGPVLLDCHIDIDEKVFPMIPPGGSVKNIILKGE
ncbi:MAG: biosynthetic-type acetolactate synthase large subunit [Filifactoraceae bacterium]